MTNTIPNVPRDDLDLIRAALEGFKPCIARDDALRTVRALLSTPSPAGVDGLEVVGYIDSDDEVASSYAVFKNDCDLRDGTELVRLSDAQAIIDGLRGEVGAQRVKTCTALKERNDARAERDQQAQRIGELEGLLRDSAELIKHGVFEDGICCCGSSVDSHGFGDGHSPVDALAYHAGQVCERIDAALSAGKEGE